MSGHARDPTSPAASARVSKAAVRKMTSKKGQPNQDAWAACPSAGVYIVADGHGSGGEAASHSAVDALHSSLRSLGGGGGGGGDVRECEIKQAVSRAFAHAAEVVDGLPCAWYAGTTATVAVLREAHEEGGDALLVLGNVGDSDAVVCGFREGSQALVVSRRHRPDDPDEHVRCSAAGGSVDGGRRYVMNDASSKRIAVTRALGDRDMRGCGVISEPDVRVVRVATPAFLLVATDGLWGAHGGVSPQAAADVVRSKGVSNGLEVLMEMACGSERCPSDDCTVFIVPIGCDGSAGGGGGGGGGVAGGGRAGSSQSDA